MQAIIARLSANSFMEKGWSITLVTAIIGFGVNAKNAALIAIAGLPALLFWALDGYYLSLERAYRTQYAGVLEETDTASLSLSLSDQTSRFKMWGRALRAAPVAILHGVLFLAAIIAATLISRQGAN